MQASPNLHHQVFSVEDAPRTTEPVQPKQKQSLRDDFRRSIIGGASVKYFEFGIADLNLTNC
jgi:hypothetical protein